MADLPITSDEGATPVVINDPVTTANVAGVNASSALKTDRTTVAGVAVATAAAGIQKVGVTDGSGTAITSTAVGVKQGLDTTAIASPSQIAASLGQVYVTSFEVDLPANGTETPTVYIKNPTASGKTLILKIVSATCEDATNGAAVIRLYGDPITSVNGTSETVSSTSIGGGAAASVMTAFSGPTVSVNGTLLFAINTGSGNVANAGDMPLNFDGLIRVSANHTLLITGEPSTNNMNYSFTVMWQEV
jgi:hypothetical protein